MPSFVIAGLAVALLVLTFQPMMSRVAAQSTPQAQRYGHETQEYASDFAAVLTELDAFWFDIFRASGGTYRTPVIVALEQRIMTGCGPAGPEDFAFYCPADAAVYYSPEGFADHERRIGDFAPIVVIAHEWGHHVQWLLDIAPKPGNAFELQADCLAGAYASYAGQRGLLDPGDVTEAVASSAEAGDPLGLPQDAPGAHGINDDRVISFMRGYLDGATGCDIPLAAGLPPQPSGPPSGPEPGPDSQSVSRNVVPPPELSTLVPAALDLPHEQSFRLVSEGATTLETLAAGFPDPVEASRLLQAWQWNGNIYRYFASDDPPPDGAGWVELSIHRFANADAAAAALSYFAAGRASELGLSAIDVELFGDQSEAVGGQAYNGTEMTIYARRGNLLIRATAISPSGNPRADATEVALIPLRQLIDHVGVVSPNMLDLLPPPAVMPAGLQPAGDHARSAGTNADTFVDPIETGERFQAWGWREHVARSFVADGPGTANGTTQFDVAVYRFADPWGASLAMPYFVDARAEALGLHEVAGLFVGDEARAIQGPVAGGQEATLYVRVGDTLMRFTAIGSGQPMADIEALLNRPEYRI
jgi:predicted metalloprotease